MAIEQQLTEWFRDAKGVVVAGIGNPIRQDDNVGLRIVEAMQGKVRADVCLLECGTVPESYVLDIEESKPSHVLLIDAAVLGHKPGEASLILPEALPNYSAVSSHMLPLRLFCEYIQKTTNSKIALLLIEPQSFGFGEGLTLPVEKSAKKLVLVLIGLLS
jgi:hydrogenase 3 maturation protease